MANHTLSRMMDDIDFSPVEVFDYDTAYVFLSMNIAVGLLCFIVVPLGIAIYHYYKFECHTVANDVVARPPPKSKRLINRWYCMSFPLVVGFSIMTTWAFQTAASLDYDYYGPIAVSAYEIQASESWKQDGGFVRKRVWAVKVLVQFEWEICSSSSISGVVYDPCTIESPCEQNQRCSSTAEQDESWESQAAECIEAALGSDEVPTLTVYANSKTCKLTYELPVLTELKKLEYTGIVWVFLGVLSVFIFIRNSIVKEKESDGDTESNKIGSDVVHSSDNDIETTEASKGPVEPSDNTIVRSNVSSQKSPRTKHAELL